MKTKDISDNKDFKIKDLKWQTNWTGLDTREERIYELINDTKGFA